MVTQQVEAAAAAIVTSAPRRARLRGGGTPAPDTAPESIAVVVGGDKAEPLSAQMSSWTGRFWPRRRGGLDADGGAATQCDQ